MEIKKRLSLEVGRLNKTVGNKSYDLPEDWFENEDGSLADSVLAVFLCERKANFGLFLRTFDPPRDWAFQGVPMAVSRTGEVFVVLDGKLETGNEPVVRLMLKAKNGCDRWLQFPFSCLATHENYLVLFLEWVLVWSALFMRTPLPDYVFARNLELK